MLKATQFSKGTRVRHIKLTGKTLICRASNQMGFGSGIRDTDCAGSSAKSNEREESNMLQNRVNPRGELCAVPDRGNLMGNRGILHNERREIVSNWRHKHWVTCLLAFKEIQRPKPFSTMDNYSELFFLDEATAFAAGHRPCNYCQRERLTEFKNAWVLANRPGSQPKDVRMDDIDQVLHSERVLRGGIKSTYTAKLGQLPFGTVVEHDKQALLIGKCGLYRWSFSGYSLADSLPASTAVSVLTPLSVVKSFECGFSPKTAAEIHVLRSGASE